MYASRFELWNPKADYVSVASYFNIIEPDIYVLSLMPTSKAKTSLHMYVFSPMYLLPKMLLSMRTKHRQPLARLDCCACILRTRDANNHALFRVITFANRLDPGSILGPTLGQA